MSRLRRTAEGILDDVRLALQSREPTGGMRVPYLGDWAGVVRTPSGARALEQLRRTLEGALDEPGTPVSMLTAADVETLREDAAAQKAQANLPRSNRAAGTNDREALLAHVDALQTQLDEARSSVDAWVHCHDDWQRQMAELQAQFDAARAEVERLKAERDLFRSTLMSIAQGHAFDAREIAKRSLRDATLSEREVRDV